MVGVLARDVNVRVCGQIDYTYIPLDHERIEIGVPHLDGRELEQLQQLGLLVAGLLLEFVDLNES